MAKGKKKKPKARRLPLSPLDKLCYILFAVLSFVLAFGVWFLEERISREIAYGEAGVIGFHPHWCFPFFSFFFCFVFFAPIAGFSLYWLETKQPLFGNRGFQKKFSAPLLPTYPLFTPAYFASLTARYKKTVKRIFLSWAMAALLLFGACLCTVGIQCVFYRDGSIREYDAFHQVSHLCSTEAAESVRVDIDMHVHRGRNSYDLDATFHYSDHTHAYGYDSSLGEELRFLLQQKAEFGDRFETAGEEYLEAYVKRNHLNEEESALLRQLFE